MVSLSGSCAWIENGDHAAVGFGADGTAKALPQFDLHFRHNFGLDVALKIAVLLPQGFTQWVRYLKG